VVGSTSTHYLYSILDFERNGTTGPFLVVAGRQKTAGWSGPARPVGRSTNSTGGEGGPSTGQSPRANGFCRTTGTLRASCGSSNTPSCHCIFSITVEAAIYLQY